MTDLTIDGDTFRVEVEGDDAKPALLLSNSLGTDLSLWDGQMPALSEHFRVIRYDARGHGASVAGPGPYSIEQLGRDALAILDALDIATAHVMGVSMGGAVAQWLMINAPDRIARAVLANTTARFMTPEVWNGRIATVLREGMDAVAASTMERWFGETFRAEAAERVAAVEAVMRSTAPHGFAACSAALRDIDLREAIRAIEHPVLILTGADDAAISAQDTAHFLDAIVDSRHVELPARHISNIEAEAAFTQAVLDFLLAEMPARRTKRGSKPGPVSSAPARRQGRRSIAARAPLPERTTAKTNRRAVAGRAKAAAAKSKTVKPLAPRRPATKSPPGKRAAAERAAAKPAAVRSSAAKALAAKPAAVKSAGVKSAGVRGSAVRHSRITKSAIKASAATPRRAAGAARPASVPKTTTRRAASSSAKPASAASSAKTATRTSKSAAPRRTAASLAAKATRSAKGAGAKQQTRVTTAATSRTSSKAAVKKTAAKKTAAKATASKKTAPKAAAKRSVAPRKPGRPPTRRGAR